MSEDLRNRSFNLRIEVDEHGVPALGWVRGFFSVSDNVVDLKPVSEATKVELAKLLGIRGSSESFSVNRLLRTG